MNTSGKHEWQPRGRVADYNSSRCSLLRLLILLITRVHHSAHHSVPPAFATPAVRGGAFFELHPLPATKDPANFVDRGNVFSIVTVFVERLLDDVCLAHPGLSASNSGRKLDYCGDPYPCNLGCSNVLGNVAHGYSWLPLAKPNLVQLLAKPNLVDSFKLKTACKCDIYAR